jgi:predicted MFS family arabinose efflux permease
VTKSNPGALQFLMQRAAVGGLLIDAGFGYAAPTVAGAVASGLGMLLAIWGAARDKRTAE